MNGRMYHAARMKNVHLILLLTCVIFSIAEISRRQIINDCEPLLCQVLLYTDQFIVKFVDERGLVSPDQSVHRPLWLKTFCFTKKYFF